MSTHLLAEADKQVNFLNSIFDMMSSTFWSNEDSAEEDDFDGKFTLTVKFFTCVIPSPSTIQILSKMAN